MCTLLLAWRAHPDLPLVIAANRDEFYARPARPAGFWDDHPDILAGRDDKAGGTWLGITRSGHWAGLTNVRDRGSEGVGARSRGHLVSEFLSGSASPADYARAVAAEGSAYGGFNLLIGDGDSVARAGVAVRQPLIPEYEVAEEDLEDYVQTGDPTAEAVDG